MCSASSSIVCLRMKVVSACPSRIVASTRADTTMIVLAIAYHKSPFLTYYLSFIFLGFLIKI